MSPNISQFWILGKDDSQARRHNPLQPLIPGRYVCGYARQLRRASDPKILKVERFLRKNRGEGSFKVFGRCSFLTMDMQFAQLPKLCKPGMKPEVTECEPERFQRREMIQELDDGQIGPARRRGSYSQ